MTVDWLGLGLLNLLCLYPGAQLILGYFKCFQMRSHTESLQCNNILYKLFPSLTFYANDVFSISFLSLRSITMLPGIDLFKINVKIFPNDDHCTKKKYYFYCLLPVVIREPMVQAHVAFVSILQQCFVSDRVI